jgi:hypothetical protein
MANHLIRGKVAQVLNSREVALNVGKEHGVDVGMYFDIVDPKGQEVRDPDSGEVLGSLERRKVRVRVVSLKEKLCVASTYRRRKVNLGGGGGLIGTHSLTRQLMPPNWVTKYETLKTTEKTWESIGEPESYVKIGDPVVEVVESVDDDDEVLG